jgi:DNA-binding response OmpR family regulator
MTKRVLLIEDNEKLALGLRHNLEFEGYEVATAGAPRRRTTRSTS